MSLAFSTWAKKRLSPTFFFFFFCRHLRQRDAQYPQLVRGIFTRKLIPLLLLSGVSLCHWDIIAIITNVTKDNTLGGPSSEILLYSPEDIHLSHKLYTDIPTYREPTHILASAHTYSCMKEHTTSYTHAGRSTDLPSFCLAHSRAVMCLSQRVPPASSRRLIPFHFRDIYQCHLVALLTTCVYLYTVFMQLCVPDTMKSQFSRQTQLFMPVSVLWCVHLWWTCLTCPDSCFSPLPNARSEMRSSLFLAMVD